MNKKDVLTVNQLNHLARDLLENHFPMVWVEGEISNLARPSSGHMYLTLKDSEAQIRAAMFKGRNQKLRFTPEDGMQVLVRAKLSLYPARGDYQLIIDQMEEAGDGALRRAFEELKHKLTKEGLFAEENKRPLPEFPRRIGVITSPTGAAIRDIISVLKRRFPIVPVNIYPVAVQGENAAAEIISAIEKSNQGNLCDVLIVGRGGGSLEDLWAFNEEELARAIFQSDIPVVSAVGHETDFTIADFVADCRAPTPSAAAELISPDQDELMNLMKDYEQTFNLHLKNQLKHFKHQLHALQKRTRHPGQRLRDLSQRLDGLESRIRISLRHTIKAKQASLKTASAHLKSQSPENQILQLREINTALNKRLKLGIAQSIKSNSLQLRSISQQLNAVSPLATLERGYSIVRDNRGKIVKNSSQLKPGEVINAKLHVGEFKAKVTEVTSSDKKPVKK